MKKEKTSGWTVTQIDKAHQEEISKSVKAYLERKTKLDPNAIEATSRAVQGILLQQVGSLVGEIIDHAEGVVFKASPGSCSGHACSSNGIGNCPTEACDTLICQGHKCGTNSCGTKTCSGFSCTTNTGIARSIFETPAWAAVIKDMELMSKHPELRQKINISTRNKRIK